MSNHLALYLNDHLAGARFALELLESLRDANSNKPLGDFAKRLIREIGNDRSVLQQLADEVGTSGSTTIKDAASWLAEKASRLKLRLNNDNDVSTLEAVETLPLGVLGKLKLWQALSTIKSSDTRLKQMDIDPLIARAQSQHDELETCRLLLAKTALTGVASAPRSA